MMLTAYDILGLGYCVSHRDGRLVSFDPQYAAIIARSYDQMRGLMLGDVTHPEDRAAYLSAVELVATACNPLAVRKRSLRPDGSFVWVENRLAPLIGADAQILIATRIVAPPRQADPRTDAAWAAARPSARYAADLAGQLAHMCQCARLDLTGELLTSAAELAPVEADMILQGEKGPN